MSKWKEMKEQALAREQPEEEEYEYPTLEELETDLQSTLDNIDLAFRERAAKERQRYAQTCDSVYYFTVFFSNRNQLIEFCDTFDMDYTQFFFDGRELARKFKRALKTEDTKFSRVRPFSKDFVDRSMPLPDNSINK